MNLTVKRIRKFDDCTIGQLYIDGTFFAYTLEDKDRGLNQSDSLLINKAKKIFGKTAIPTGVYDVAMTYSNRFKKYLPQILNVPAFEGVRIHAGNNAEHTEGCILVGYETQERSIFQSRKATEDLIKRIQEVEKTAKIILNVC